MSAASTTTAATMSTTTTTTTTTTSNCPYLDTVRREVLDFDVPHICKTTLSDQNVYACLVCGQFFRGRGDKSPAFIHAVNESHFVYLKLDTRRAYCLPDGYEIQDPSLNDIKHELKPTFHSNELASLRSSHVIKKDVRGEDYLPGFIGLANLKATDPVNVVVQMLARVVPFQHFFLQNNTTLESCRSVLVKQFAELLRKIWNPRSFKRFVGPYQFVDALSTTSRGQFTVGKRAQALQLLQWMLNHMHKYLKKASQSNQTVVTDAFQGHLQVRRVEDESVGSASSSSSSSSSSTSSSTSSSSLLNIPFFKLSLDLPTKPLFRNDSKKNAEEDVLSTVSLFELLEKFDGRPVASVSSSSSSSDATATSTPTMSTYGLTRLPKYLILHIKRFSRNNYTMEKNGTIVSFPLRNLDMRQYMTEEARAAIPPVASLAALSNSALKAVAIAVEKDVSSVVERDDLVSVVSNAVSTYTKYDLVANVGHKVGIMSVEGNNMVQQKNPHDLGMYHAQVNHRTGKQWYQIQDLDVQEVPNELITKSEVLMLLYERKNVAS